MWNNLKLVELAEFINGYAFKPEDWSEDGLPIIRIEQLKKRSSKHDCYSGKLPDKNIINDGDLIFSWSASLFLKIWDQGRAALNQHLFKVIPHDITTRVFLKYLIEFNLEKLLLSAHGSTMQHLTRKELEKFEVYLPKNISEQNKIADILNKTDTAIAKTEELIAKYLRIKTGLMQDLLSKGIDENGNIRNKKTHRFLVKNGIEVPREWDVVELRNCSTFLDHLRRPIKESDRQDIQGEYPYYGASGIIDFINDYLFDETLILLGEDGENILSRKLPLAFLASGKYWVNNHAHVIKPNFDMDTFYLCMQLESYDYSPLNTSSAQPKITKSKIEKIFIPKPGISEQEKISSKILKADEFVNQQKLNLSKLQFLKTGLMQDLLSGKVKLKMPKMED